MRPRWDKVKEDARERFGEEPFTVCEFAEILRAYANPMEAARNADKFRVQHRRAVGGPRQDDVTVGLRYMSRSILFSAARGGTVERVDYGVYRFRERRDER